MSAEALAKADEGQRHNICNQRESEETWSVTVTQILCTDTLVKEWLARPFNVDMKDHGGYWIVRKNGSKEKALIKAFREWLLSELVETNKRLQGTKAKGNS